MASAILFYRTDGGLSGETDTRKKASGSTYYDAEDLPSAQILEFTFPDNVLESIKDSYVNNIVDIIDLDWGIYPNLGVCKPSPDGIIKNYYSLSMEIASLYIENSFQTHQECYLYLYLRCLVY